MKISCVILAAGNSTRFQKNKLLSLIDNQPMIIHLFGKIKDIAFDNVCVVTQYNEVKRYALEYGFDVVMNNHPSLGISSSIQLGVKHCENSDYILFIVSDQPGIQKQTIQKMISCMDDDIVACCYQDELVNPMLFPKKYFDELLNLKGDRGGKVIAMKHPVTKICIHDYEYKDIDTLDDLEQYINVYKK